MPQYKVFNCESYEPVSHGAPPPNSGVFLGEPYRAFQQHLAETYTEKNGWRLHYVTARELVNILHAAEDGHRGDAGQYRNYRYQLSADQR